MDISVIQRLEEELQGHLARYGELIEYLDREKRYLLDMNLDALLAVSKAKEDLARGIIAGAEGLHASLATAGAMLGLKEGAPPTLSEVAALCPRPFANRLADGAMALASLKNRILRENEQAKRFVEESLGLVNESLDILSGASQLRGDGYGQDGKKGKAGGKGLPSKLSKEI
jgi:hypothetical protein